MNPESSSLFGAVPELKNTIFDRVLGTLFDVAESLKELMSPANEVQVQGMKRREIAVRVEDALKNPESVHGVARYLQALSAALLENGLQSSDFSTQALDFASPIFTMQLFRQNSVRTIFRLSPHASGYFIIDVCDGKVITVDLFGMGDVDSHFKEQDGFEKRVLATWKKWNT